MTIGTSAAGEAQQALEIRLVRAAQLERDHGYEQDALERPAADAKHSLAVCRANEAAKPVPMTCEGALEVS